MTLFSINPREVTKMAEDSYEDAIAGLKKLLSEKNELEDAAVAKIRQLTAELEGAGGKKSDPDEKIRTKHLNTIKYN
ncbi:hypothetical protein A4A49_01531 [Nicotiana attenuata]|uniref:Uncharacterized protein n=1 Tax=Nicotiana attenuata TaxID=49451 RepID=A0A314L666_NICAT|nr:hypothetical protein A4A49_01531 [Nicotiana attenuata]